MHRSRNKWHCCCGGWYVDQQKNQKMGNVFRLLIMGHLCHHLHVILNCCLNINWLILIISRPSRSRSWSSTSGCVGYTKLKLIGQLPSMRLSQGYSLRPEIWVLYIASPLSSPTKAVIALSRCRPVIGPSYPLVFTEKLKQYYLTCLIFVNTP